MLASRVLDSIPARAVLDLLEVCPGDSAAVLAEVLAALSEGEWSDRRIAEAMGVDRATVWRARQRFGGALTRQSGRGDATDSPAGVAPTRSSATDDQAKRVAPTRRKPRVRAREPLTQELLITENHVSAPPSADSAREIVTRAWDQIDPKPIVAFGRVIKLAERLLAAGWDAGDIERAMVAAPTISDGWVEAWLSKHARRHTLKNDDARRAQPTGRIDL